LEIMIAMFAIVFLAIIAFAVVLIRSMGRNEQLAGKYAVFTVDGGQLIVLTGIPVTYDINAITKVTFSVMRGRRSTSYMGVMRIVKTNGKKSRPFLFDSSAYTKKFAWTSSRQEIEKAIAYLMEELKAYNICCSC